LWQTQHQQPSFGAAVRVLRHIRAWLYQDAEDFFFRSRGLGSAHSKTIPRRLRETDGGFASKFLAAFDALLTEKRNAPLVALVEELLAPFGGPLFDGFRMNAREKVMSD
jgi:hypothetical protein